MPVHGMWMPIETAPKATTPLGLAHVLGPPVLLWWDGEVIIGVHWTTLRNDAARIEFKEEWSSGEIDRHGQPTHWMPLPSPPTSAGES
jgi:hypothetical protein